LSDYSFSDWYLGVKRSLGDKPVDYGGFFGFFSGYAFWNMAIFIDE